MIRRSEQVKRATCAVVAMVECGLVGLALSAHTSVFTAVSHPSVFTAIGLAFAAGMTLVILFMLILEKDTDARVIDQPAVAVAVNGGTSTGTARSAMEGEMPKANGNGRSPLRREAAYFRSSLSSQCQRPGRPPSVTPSLKRPLLDVISGSIWCLEAVLVHASECRHARMGDEMRAAIDHRRQSRGQSAARAQERPRPARLRSRRNSRSRAQWPRSRCPPGWCRARSRAARAVRPG